MAGTIGPEANLLDPGPESVPPDRAAAPDPRPTRSSPRSSTSTRTARPGFPSFAVDGLYPVAEGGDGPAPAPWTTICAEVSAAIADGARIIVLSDRYSNEELAPIPSLLLTAAVHHHLIRENTRTKVGLVVETGDAREVHHMALLLGFGAAAINPYLAFETIDDLIARGRHHRASRRSGRRATTSRRAPRAC